MATGIPLNNKSAKMDYQLSYEGKEDIDSILSAKSKTHYKLQEQISFSTPIDLKGKFVLGDNIESLRYLLETKGPNIIDAVYIDPPYAKQAAFNTKQHNKAYEDNLFGAEYLEFLRKRLVLIHSLLKPTGSIFVHLDETMAFTVKILMDEIFGPSNFHNWITRKKSNPKNTVTRKFGDISDYIMFYSKSNKYHFYTPREEIDIEKVKREYHYIEKETNERYKVVPIYGPGIRNGKTGQKWHGMYPPAGKHWQYTPDKLTELDKNNQIHWSKNGNPRRKIYLKDYKGPVMQDILLGYKDATNQNIKVTGYPTEKNLDLVKLLLSTVTKPGDLVLDAFAGSGTAAEAAIDLKCNWIMMDNSLEALKATKKRLNDMSINSIDDIFKNVSECVVNIYKGSNE
ncbi:site-specific DNA-methyltransferase [Lactobacillus kitasatonis]|uniref:site-specific DNA-methyltransferase n=1 Tax=Lactobacillus kitasatonis TaxID=237446 RepID=UPI0026E9DC25|nr:site-specific DNA-methyltransferase [Lactobacillus kitasatonis]